MKTSQSPSPPPGGAIARGVWPTPSHHTKQKKGLFQQKNTRLPFKGPSGRVGGFPATRPRPLPLLDTGRGVVRPTSGPFVEDRGAKRTQGSVPPELF